MTDSRPPGGKTGHPDAAHEPSDVSFGGVLGFGLGLLLVAAVLQVGLYFLLKHWLRSYAEEQRPVSPLAAEERGKLPPGPVLEGVARMSAPERLARRDAAHQAPPGDYGWADRPAGAVKIPIADAMRIAAGKLPSRPGAAPGAAKETVRPSPSNTGRTLERGQP